MYNQCCGKSPLLSLQTTCSKFKSDESRSTYAQCSIKKTKHGYNTPHYIVKSIVIRTKFIQYNTGCIQCHSHDNKHPEIQKNSVLCYTLVIRYLRHYKINNSKIKKYIFLPTNFIYHYNFSQKKDI